MRNFLQVSRIDPTKRLVVERTKDFGEIYEVFQKEDASLQGERCIQCGDPFCLNKCPLHNYIPQWLKSVAEKDLEFAFNLSNEPSPFPEVMGRVCPHDRLCEGDCTLNDGHGAITIGSIETFINEEGFKAGLTPKFPGITTDKKVAIIGSGPAGLSAATYLLRAGIAVTVYERDDRAGGLLTYGIPNFKLDKKVIERRVKILKDAGMELVVNCEVGKDITFDEMADKHDAIFIGVGATKAVFPEKKQIMFICQCSTLRLFSVRTLALNMTSSLTLKIRTLLSSVVVIPLWTVFVLLNVRVPSLLPVFTVVMRRTCLDLEKSIKMRWKRVLTLLSMLLLKRSYLVKTAERSVFR
jgi:ferredoxin